MRLSLRVKFSLIIVVGLMLSIGVITTYAARLFIQDKSSYILEVNAMAAQDRAMSVSQTLNHLREKMRIFAGTYRSPHATDASKRELLQDFFKQYQEFLLLSIYREDGSVTNLFKSARLDALSLDVATLQKRIRESDFSFEEVASGRASVFNATVDPRLPAFAFAATLGTTNAGREIVLGVVDMRMVVPEDENRGTQEVFLVDNKGRVIFHPNPTYMLQQENFGGSEIVQMMFSQGGSVKAGTKSVRSETGREMLAAYALLDGGKAGVVVQVPRDVAFQGAKLLILNASYVAAVILILAIFVGLFFAGSVTQPVKELARATRRIAKGDFNLQIRSRTGDEIGDLARSFNKMGSELLDREKALQEANQKLIQSEKMAAFGQLGAGIAHEVKNPLAGILGYAQLAKKRVPEDDPVHKNLAIIEKETKRCKEIIENLLKFARQEKALFEPTDLNQITRESLVLVEHQLTLNKVKIVREIPEGASMIVGNGNQLQQVFLNFMMNAQHAMEPNGGELRVWTAVKGNMAEVHLKDTGCGIPEEIRKRIFEPFFTTKPAGKGTGLGLSVSFGIIADHKGEILCESQVGKGTEFIIRIPTMSAQAKTATPAAKAEGAGAKPPEGVNAHA